MRMTVSGASASCGFDMVDLHDPMLYGQGEPHSVWRHLRRHSPVHRNVTADGRSFWSVTRHQDVMRVLRDHEVFTSARGNLLTTLGTDDVAGGRMVTVTDPPHHARLRAPQVAALTAGVRGTGGTRMREAVRALLRPALDGSPWDLARAATRLPLMALGPVMGLPAADWPALGRLAFAAVAPDDPVYAAEGTRTTLATAHHELFSYFRAALRSRHRSPADDLLTRLLPPAGEDTRAAAELAVYHCYSLLLGAVTTLPHTVSATALAMAENSRVIEAMRQGPQALATGVEEALRWSSPAAHVLRHTTRPVELAGVPLSRGEAVVAWLGSANRDEAVFPDPYRFDPGRTPNRHLAFGYGPHYCLGAALARASLTAVLVELVDAVEAVEVCGPVEHLNSHFIAGINRLPVRLTPRRRAAH
ncbi:cytochrome P450 [Streptomyces pilosus]|uniref:cytochrome P450 n=1 Tax=Streptomyces pilosus TaxID=28893 RepID=UPI0036F4B92D